jgi:hypothetical protein
MRRDGESEHDEDGHESALQQYRGDWLRQMDALLIIRLVVVVWEGEGKEGPPRTAPLL